MFSHIMIGTNDLDRAKGFYDSLLGALGVPPARVDGNRIFYMTPTGAFSVSKPIDGEPATHANGGAIGFAASSPAQADAWHATGLAAGGATCEDPPWRSRRRRGQDGTWPIFATAKATSCVLCFGCKRRPRGGYVIHASRSPALAILVNARSG